MQLGFVVEVDDLHDKGNKDSRASTLQKKIGKGLKNGIRNKENRKGRIVLAC